MDAKLVQSINLRRKKMKDVIDEFEKGLREALQYKYRNEPQIVRESLVRESFVRVWNIDEFYALYLEKGIYPQERVNKLIYQLFDIKIEIFYIMELDVGLYNHLVYGAGFDKNKIDNLPYIILRKLSLDQTLIVKSRILWERVMNFIYYLETGKDLEGRSKKTRFFRLIKNTKWSYLERYKDYIEWFDDKLRTPEVHKGSFLRRLFQTGVTRYDQEMLKLLNIVSNAVWKNLLQIIQGRQPCIFYEEIPHKNGL